MSCSLIDGERLVSRDGQRGVAPLFISQQLHTQRYFETTVAHGRKVVANLHVLLTGSTQDGPKVGEKSSKQQVKFGIRKTPY